MDKSIENAVRQIRLEQELWDDAIKEYTTEDLVDKVTGEHYGYAVSLRLAASVQFSNHLLEKWKELFIAERYYIWLKRNTLWVRYYVYYDNET